MKGIFGHMKLLPVFVFVFFVCSLPADLMELLPAEFLLVELLPAELRAYLSVH